MLTLLVNLTGYKENKNKKHTSVSPSSEERAWNQSPVWRFRCHRGCANFTNTLIEMANALRSALPKPAPSSPGAGRWPPNSFPLEKKKKKQKKQTRRPVSKKPRLSALAAPRSGAEGAPHRSAPAEGRQQRQYAGTGNEGAGASSACRASRPAAAVLLGLQCSRWWWCLGAFCCCCFFFNFILCLCSLLVCMFTWGCACL